MKQSVLIFIFIICIQVTGAMGATFTVTNTAGNAYSCGPNVANTNVCLAVGTLGWAISSANANPGPDVIDFNLPSGSIITVDNPNWLLITGADLTIDATVGSMAAAWAAAGSCNPIIQITCGFSNGFDINGVSGVTIRGLAFNMQGNCVTFRGAGVTSGGVFGCWAGLTLAGTAASANIAQQAVVVQGGASGVTIGGNTCAQRNVLLGNNNGGVYLDNGDNNIVRGNYFNTNAAGLAHISPGSPQAAIRLVNGSTGNLVENNIVTINTGQAGIYVEGGSNNPIFRNNYIGFNTTGVTTVPNAPPTYHGTSHGMILDGSTGGRIENCVIGNFSKDGIHFQGTNTNSWTVVGCKIGTDVSGTLDRGNRERGIFSDGAVTDHIVGGPTVAERNIISGNGGTTDAQGAMYNGCTNCWFENNYVGVDATGNTCLPNGNSGFFLQTTVNNCTFINNVIGCNGYGGTGGSIHGIQFFGPGSGNTITNNRIGVGANGTANIGNSQDGVSFNGAQTGNTISNNIIANNQWGIFFQGGGGSHIVIGNTIYTNGATPVPGGFGFVRFTNNEGGGICAQSGSNNNEIGRAIAGQGNNIYDNLVGIHLRGDPGGSTGNLVYNNTITSSRLGNYTKFATDYSGSGIAVTGGSNTQKIGGTAALQPNLINYNRGRGVFVHSSDFVEIRRNSIYCNGNTAVERSTPTFAIYLLSANGGITKPGPITYATPNGLAGNNVGIPSAVTPDNVTAGDVIEVYFDNECGCQLKTYLGNGTVSGSDWNYSAAGNPTVIPTAGYCQIGGLKADGSACTAPGITSGWILTSVTATRTTNPATATARTSEPMDCSPTTLPVELISFTAKRNGTNSAILNWITATEKNNAYFEILRSTDGRTFTVVGSVEGRGNSAFLSNYSFRDEALIAGTYYYMLNQVDFDGTSQFSEIRVVSLAGDSDFDVVPTAVAAGDQIRILNFTGEEISNLSVIDMSGRLYFSENNVSGSVKDLNTYGLASGVYLVKIVAGDKVVTEKVVVY